MTIVRAKKNLGQHFLKDQNIAYNITEGLSSGTYDTVLEIGPGMGVLTQFLLPKKEFKTYAIDVDRESIEYLHNKYSEYKDRIIYDDFLKMDIEKLFDKPFAVIGNFPYNISSQIFFKILEKRDMVLEVVCMIQKEVAERISANHGNKTYGILSVLLQSFYDIEYMFTVHEHVFDPPPRVKSAVIRLKRNSRQELGVNERLFFRVIKEGFNKRRKTLRNSLKAMLGNNKIEHEFMSKRPEQLSVEQFIELTKLVEDIL